MALDVGNHFVHKMMVLPRLGVANILRVGLHRIALRMGRYERRMPIGDGLADQLFTLPSPGEAGAVVTDPSQVRGEAQTLLAGRFPFFSDAWHDLGSPPDWFLNPHSGRRFPDPGRHWSRVNEGDSTFGDIKLVWEPSRWDWALILARAWRCSGDEKYLRALNEWAADWTKRNPFCCGPNWKCGQETSIRMLQVLLTAFLLRQLDAPTPALQRFISEHCRRIPPTLSYAIAQDNNHGTSEAAALFIGGSWLADRASDPTVRRQAVEWQDLGRKWLENRVGRLVAADGSFSQYSSTYQRVLVDTVNLVEWWRRRHSLPAFSARFEARCRAAVDWLYNVTDPVSGDAPNLGSNDGARLFNLSTAAYRDFRPSVQLGAVLFLGSPIYPEGGAWDEPLFWLEVNKTKSTTVQPRRSRHFSDGGYVLFCPRGECDSWGFLRYPRFRFRPHHGDGLHFDLWHRGVNLLRDSGSYSYHAEAPWGEYFTSPAAHNTVQFDGRHQMPIIGRFLYGAWCRMDEVSELREEGDRTRWSGTMRDYRGATHRRTVLVGGGSWRIEDEIRGFGQAVLRWRLAPGEWRLNDRRCVGAAADLSVTSDRPVVRSELVEGWESRHYWEKSPLPVWEIEIRGNEAKIVTEIRLKEGER